MNEYYDGYGSKLDERDAEPRQLLTLIKISKATGNEKVYSICPDCKRISNISDSFCRYCGKRLRRKD